MKGNNTIHATVVAAGSYVGHGLIKNILISGALLLGLLYLPSLAYAMENSSYDLNSSIDQESADQSNHTHSNTTDNSTNSTQHAPANLTLTAIIT